MYPEANIMIARAQRKWQLAELCSPVKFWVAIRRAQRMKGQWHALHGGGNVPREARRNRLLLDILQREGAEIERQQAATQLKGDML